MSSKSKQNKKKNNKKQNRKSKPKSSFTKVQRAPVASVINYIQRNPRMSSTRGGFNVQHTELITTLTNSTGTYVVAQYPVNPGISVTFPWLSAIAIKFDKYRFKKLSFSYHTIAPTLGTGDVFLIPDYDATDLAPDTVEKAANTSGTKSGAIWKNFTLNVDCKSLHSSNPHLFVREQLVGSERLSYDGMSLSIASDTDVGRIGRVYVTYDVDFFKPQTSLDTNYPPLKDTINYVDDPRIVTGNSNSSIKYVGITSGIPSMITSATAISGASTATIGGNVEVTSEDPVDVTAGTSARLEYVLETRPDGGAWGALRSIPNNIAALAAGYTTYTAAQFVFRLRKNEAWRIMRIVTDFAGGGTLSFPEARANLQNIV